MIDIVFLLLVFFVMTFRVTAIEGDFFIEPPAQAAAGPPDHQPPPLTVPSPSPAPPTRVRSGVLTANSPVWSRPKYSPAATWTTSLVLAVGKGPLRSWKSHSSAAFP